MRSPHPKTPGFGATLRPYQREGLAWLNRRAAAGYGAILADEMGLGKTVQALALIAATRAAKGDGLPVLIVAPTSLMSTWKREAETFVPDLSVLILHGASRAKEFPKIISSAIVITSYGSLVRDVESYPDLEFSLLVADEASYLRNPKTKTAKAIAKVRARARLGLTGTPIENSLSDLWAILEFAVPGYLGRRDDFLARFGAESGDGGLRLRRKIAPFVLRRTKSEVATDLPSKVERVIYCPLSNGQRKVYESLLRESRKLIANPQNGKDQQNGRLEVLTVLLRLRQACCDLRLLPAKKLPAKSESGKLKALETLLDQALSAGHRVLVFSQFVSMLDLVRQQLDSAGLNYAYLDGSTPAQERARQVERFQDPASQIPIFLISLKAGGYGLTLTAADTVIHLDPWWNPAVEAQATDRAHRIGQTRPVTAYKFISSGTIEEKILNLQRRKQHLIGTALDEQQPLMTGLSDADIAELLS